MIRLILAIIASLACGYAVYTDFKFRYINDWLTWGLVVVGLTGHAIISLLEWNIYPLLFSIGAAAVFFAIGHVFFYTGALGGGDVKLLTGLAATIPIYPAILEPIFTPSLAEWPFLVTLMASVLLVGVVYSIVYLIVRAALKYKFFKPIFLDGIKPLKKLAIVVVVLLASVGVLAFFELELALVVALLIVLSSLAIVLIPFSKAVEQIMIYPAKPSELEAGDRPVGEIKVGKKIVYKPRRIGMNEADVERLQVLEKLGKIDKIAVKDGIPYAPAILLGLLFSLLLGDLFMLLLVAG